MAKNNLIPLAWRDFCFSQKPIGAKETESDSLSKYYLLPKYTSILKALCSVAPLREMFFLNLKSERTIMRTILLLFASNVFMIFAWYSHLNHKELALWKAILISWGIAFFEYCLTIPANRWGYAHGFNGFQLKMTQEVVTLIIFSFFAVLYLKESFH